MSKRPTIDLPPELASEAAEAARAAGESLETFVARAVASEIERDRTDKFFAERQSRADAGLALGILSRTGGEAPQAGDELPAGYPKQR
jgi:hypothetical protein